MTGPTRSFEPGGGGGGLAVADGAVAVWAVAVHGHRQRLGRHRVDERRLLVVVVRPAVIVRAVLLVSRCWPCGDCASLSGLAMRLGLEALRATVVVVDDAQAHAVGGTDGVGGGEDGAVLDWLPRAIIKDEDRRAGRLLPGGDGDPTGLGSHWRIHQHVEPI